MSDLYFYGGGGHFKVACHIAQLNPLVYQQSCVNGFTIKGIYDEYKLDNDLYMGNFQDLLKDHDFGHDKQYFCSIGDNTVRQKIMEQKPDALWINLIHPSAELSNVKMGYGNIICAGVIFEPDCEIGNGCIINTRATINHDCKIGDYVHIAPSSNLCGNVSIGNKTFIGAGSTVIQKITIGEKCVIGSGSNVIRNIPNNTKAFGNPCKIK